MPANSCPRWATDGMHHSEKSSPFSVKNWSGCLYPSHGNLISDLGVGLVKRLISCDPSRTGMAANKGCNIFRYDRGHIYSRCY